jgi:hypothetical protein
MCVHVFANYSKNRLEFHSKLEHDVLSPYSLTTILHLCSARLRENNYVRTGMAFGINVQLTSQVIERYIHPVSYIAGGGAMDDYSKHKEKPNKSTRNS